jgi:hypothetical protein
MREKRTQEQNSNNFIRTTAAAITKALSSASGLCYQTTGQTNWDGGTLGSA